MAGMAGGVAGVRRGTPPPPTVYGHCTTSLASPSDQREKTKFAVWKILSVHFSYTDFWVPDPPLPPVLILPWEKPCKHTPMHPPPPPTRPPVHTCHCRA